MTASLTSSAFSPLRTTRSVSANVDANDQHRYCRHVVEIHYGIAFLWHSATTRAPGLLKRKEVNRGFACAAAWSFNLKPYASCLSSALHKATVDFRLAETRDGR